jgi:hypothetical protein
MTLLLCFLLATVVMGMVFSRLGPWMYVLVTASAAFTTLLYYSFSRFWG